MKIKARIDRMVSGDRVKAIASVSLDGQFVVKGLRVVDGSKGLFVAPPQSSYKDGEGKNKYSDIFFPISNAGKSSLQDAVLNAYSQELEKVQGMNQSAGFDNQNSGGMLPFGM